MPSFTAYRISSYKEFTFIVSSSLIQFNSSLSPFALHSIIEEMLMEIILLAEIRLDFTEN